MKMAFGGKTVPSFTVTSSTNFAQLHGMGVGVGVGGSGVAVGGTEVWVAVGSAVAVDVGGSVAVGGKLVKVTVATSADCVNWALMVSAAWV